MMLGGLVRQQTDITYGNHLVLLEHRGHVSARSPDAASCGGRDEPAAGRSITHRSARPARMIGFMSRADIEPAAITANSLLRPAWFRIRSAYLLASICVPAETCTAAAPRAANSLATSTTASVSSSSERQSAGEIRTLIGRSAGHAA